MDSSTSISKNLKCLVLRNNLQFFVEDEKVTDFEKILMSGNKTFVKLEGNLISTSDVVGIFTPDVMEEYTHLKKGDWKCKHNSWHKKFESCECGRR